MLITRQCSPQLCCCFALGTRMCVRRKVKKFEVLCTALISSITRDGQSCLLPEQRTSVHYQVCINTTRRPCCKTRTLQNGMSEEGGSRRRRKPGECCHVSCAVWGNCLLVTMHPTLCNTFTSYTITPCSLQQ